ncbi:hypothetical protein RE628_03365 [Paenibacillus sp. D2_2]|uniref:hypothetical protein n=1 Tax=Paenibacillus sp. D2_2 TaxID=3073092 RepID=UPI002816191A|nr:hypothetical protein [Paenibacillus sp. D2_2]WMT41579.1 hypothetical protein RE628_03365 [Paenibacillus sp. D2_2]
MVEHPKNVPILSADHPDEYAALYCELGHFGIVQKLFIKKYYLGIFAGLIFSL